MDNKRTTKFPNRIRNASSRGSNVSKTNGLSTMSKIVFLLISKFKDRFPDGSPSYQYMFYKYGITNPSFSRSIKELESFGAIKTSTREYGSKGILHIDILKDKLLDGGFEFIPNLILDCDVYTNNHKLFLAMLWKVFYKRNIKGNLYLSTQLSDNAICKEMLDIGFSRHVVLRMLKELSNPEHGWIPCLQKLSRGYEINHLALIAISDRNEDRWNDLKTRGKGLFNFPVYQKPEPFDFSYSQTEESWRITEHRVERTPAIIKKLSKGDETYEEAKERFNNENFEEYED